MVRVYIHNVNGFVGSAIAEVLAAAEHEVVGSFYEENVAGTLVQNKSVTELASVKNLDKVNDLIMSSDAIIFPAAESGALDHTRAALRLLKRGGYEGTKQFLLISSVMTWARSKIAGVTAETGLKEENYTKRKAAASCSELKTLETQAMALARENLQTCVIAPGLMYGAGESTLHALFRQAWLCEGPLPIVHSARQGGNVLPMIHVKDMAKIVHSAVESQPESKYVVAVDKSRSTLREVVTEISDKLGIGSVQDLSREETQELMLSDPDVGSLNMHLFFNCEDGATISTMGIEWTCEEGMVANSASVLQEYKDKRDLRPVRIVVNGPPSLRETIEFSKKLSNNYFLPIVTPESAIKAALYEPPAWVPPVSSEDGEDEQEAPEPPEQTESEAAATELREEVKAAGDSISDVLLCKVIRTALRTRQCTNQGWILRGYPKTWREATGLWAAGDLEEGGPDEVDVEAPLPEAEEEGTYEPNGVVSFFSSSFFFFVRSSSSYLSVSPTSLFFSFLISFHPSPPSSLHVPFSSFNLFPSQIFMDGSDDWLTELAMESEGTKEEEFKESLDMYRSRNADDNERSVASFFESVLRIETISHTLPSTAELLDDTCLAIERGSKPFNYHPTPQEEADALLSALEEARKTSELQAEEELKKKQEEEEERSRRESEQSKRLEEIRQQEEELLEARSAPLRAYLMKHVIPTLTEGLIETCKVMPEDPVDYLAEFMFRASPAVESKTGKK